MRRKASYHSTPKGIYFFAGAREGPQAGIMIKYRIRSRSEMFSFYKSRIIAFNKLKIALTR